MSKNEDNLAHVRRIALAVSFAMAELDQYGPGHVVTYPFVNNKGHRREWKIRRLDGTRLIISGKNVTFISDVHGNVLGAQLDDVSAKVPEYTLGEITFLDLVSRNPDVKQFRIVRDFFSGAHDMAKDIRKRGWIDKRTVEIIEPLTGLPVYPTIYSLTDEGSNILEYARQHGYKGVRPNLRQSVS